MHVDGGVYMYNVVIKLYNEAAWGEMILQEKSILDQLNSAPRRAIVLSRIATIPE